MNYLQVFVEWSNWIWRSAFNHLWQGTLFFLLALLASLLLRGGSARARYFLWLAASIKFAVPSALIAVALGVAGISLQSAIPSQEQIKRLEQITPVVSPLVIPSSYLVARNSDLSPEKSSHESRLPNTGLVLSLAAGAVWLLGAAAFLSVWLSRRRQLSFVIKSGRLVRGGREWNALERVKSWLGITRRIDLIVTSSVTEPGVWRVIRPIILLPETVTSHLSDEELEALMMHELGHVLRWDNLVSNMNMILCCILWFNPIVWLLDNRLLKEREEACDEMVLRWSGTGEIYASSLRKICRFCLTSRVSGLSTAGGSKLKYRLERLMTNDGDKRFSLVQGALVSAVICGSVMLTVVAAMQPGDKVIGQANKVLIRATQDLKQIANPAAPDCAEPNSKKCLPPTSSAVAADNKLGEVVIRPDSNSPLETGAPTIVLVNEPQTAQPPVVPTPPTPKPEQVSSFQSAHAVNLERFVGRYAVDPSFRENFVLDVSAQDGQLFLKPSHVNKHRLIAQSIVEYVDSEAPNTRITFNLDDRGIVASLTLRGWGPTIEASHLVLPEPSRVGNIVFRLSGFPTARIVAVAGTFNGWNQSQYLFERVGDEWICRINLPRGRYQYKFIVDGNWLVDPNNPTIVRDRRGFENSDLMVD